MWYGKAFSDSRCSLQLTFPDGIGDVLRILDMSLFMEKVDQFADRSTRIGRFQRVLDAVELQKTVQCNHVEIDAGGVVEQWERGGG